SCRWPRLRESRCAPARSSAAHLLELLEQLAAALVQLLRHLDAHAREEVALTGALQLRRAAALDLQQLAVLGTGRDLQRHRAGGRGPLDAAAERGGREADRHLDDEVGLAAALVDRRGSHARDDVQVARRPACHAGLPLALEPNTSPVLDPRRDLHRVALRPPLAAGAVTAVARLLDHGAVAAAARARLREREESLRLGLHAAAVALRADDGHGARLRAGAAALTAGAVDLDGDLGLNSLERVVERDVDERLEVVA